jgi:DNA-binding NarL/FixJ family response regulator
MIFCILPHNLHNVFHLSLMKKKTRILLADDHEIVRRGIRPLLESEWGWEVCGEATNGREAVEMAAKLKPDIVILDVSMPQLSGVEATRQIKRENPETQVLVFTGQESETLVHQLFSAGARAFVLKNEAAAQLIPSIKALCGGQPYFGSSVSKIIFDQYLKGGLLTEQSAPDGLSPREREIVQLLAEGKSNKEVATALGISVKTAETHRAAIMKKLDMKSFSELVRYAVRNHIVQA